MIILTHVDNLVENPIRKQWITELIYFILTVFLSLQMIKCNCKYNQTLHTRAHFTTRLM